MFSEYFQDISKNLVASLEKNLKETEGKPGPRKKSKVYGEFYLFLKEHLPSYFTMATGKVRNKKHLLNKSADILVYRKPVPKILDMIGGYVYVDLLYSFLNVEKECNESNLNGFLALTSALKTLYRLEHGLAENEIVKIYSVQFSYSSEMSLEEIRHELHRLSVEQQNSVTDEPDMMVIMDQGIVIKNWENGGEYNIIETKEDTLMWFYILLLEFLDRDETVGFDPRSFVRDEKEYTIL